MWKRVLCVVLAVCLAAVMVIPVSAQSGRYTPGEDVTVSAQSAYVVFLGSDMSTDIALFSRNETTPIAPAGLVRVLFGLHAYRLIEEKGINPDTAAVTYSAKFAGETYDATAGSGVVDADLEVGDTWTLTDLLSVAMIADGTDTVTMIANELAGSTKAFVEGMNNLAMEIGCTDTHVVNPYGVYDPLQYTTARDMYVVMRYAMLNYPEVTELMGQNGYYVTPLDGAERSGASTNELLRQYSDYAYPKTVFGRFGYDATAGASCASVAKLEGFDIMTVVMGCPSSSTAFVETASLFDWTEKTFTYQSIVRKNQPIHRVGVDLAWNTDSVALVSKQDVNTVIRLDTELTSLTYNITVDRSLLNADGNLTATVDTETVIATVQIFDGDIMLAEVPLYAAKQIPRSKLLAVLDTVWTVLSSPFVIISLIVLVILFVAYVVISVMHNKYRRKKKRKKIKRY